MWFDSVCCTQTALDLLTSAAATTVNGGEGTVAGATAGGQREVPRPFTLTSYWIIVHGAAQLHT